MTNAPVKAKVALFLHKGAAMDVKFLVEADPKTVEPMAKELARLGVSLFGLTEEEQRQQRKTPGSLICTGCGDMESLQDARMVKGVMDIRDITSDGVRQC